MGDWVRFVELPLMRCARGDWVCFVEEGRFMAKTPSIIGTPGPRVESESVDLRDLHGSDPLAPGRAKLVE